VRASVTWRWSVLINSVVAGGGERGDIIISDSDSGGDDGDNVDGGGVVDSGAITGIGVNGCGDGDGGVDDDGSINDDDDGGCSSGTGYAALSALYTLSSVTTCPCCLRLRLTD
jgi:hypothetical protein